MLLLFRSSPKRKDGKDSHASVCILDSTSGWAGSCMRRELFLEKMACSCSLHVAQNKCSISNICDRFWWKPLSQLSGGFYSRQP